MAADQTGHPEHRAADAACCRDGGPAAQGPVPLTNLKVGSVGVVCETCMDRRDAAMLRAMGLRPRARIRVCRLGEPWIIEVQAGVVADGSCDPAGTSPCAKPGGCACRIGLARALAERVLLEPGSVRDAL